MRAPGESADKVADLNEHRRRKKPRRSNGLQHVWTDRLIWGRDGPRDCVANVALVLREDPAFTAKLSYNLMRSRVAVGSLPWHVCDQLRDWTDRDGIALAEWVQLHGLVAKPSTCEQAVRTVAAEHSVHPLRERLEALQWGGDERLSDWLTTYLGVDATDYSRAIGRAWMISGVARAFEPGCKADHALILEGCQGKLKSTLAEIIALEREWFTDEIADLGSKDSAQDLPGKWIIEISELASMRKALIEKIKAFLSRSVDHYRPSYGRHSQDFPRGCIFIGSTNETQYLQDTTGNRRFWPVKVGKIDLEGLRHHVEELWAEAVHAYREGEPWWLDEAHEEEAAKEQVDRLQGDPWGDLVLTAAEKIRNREPVKHRDFKGYIVEVTAPGDGLVTTNAILELLNVPEERRGRREETRIGTILTAAGWTRNSARRSTPRYWYTPPADLEG